LPEATAFVALGANLDQPAAHIERAAGELDRLPGTRLARVSTLYRSRPIGYAAQPDFINAVAALRTRLAPRELLGMLLRIELRHGRRRAFKNAPRTLDLDLLLYDDLRLDEPGITLPHPRMSERAFVLVPLLEIAPDIGIPGHGLARDCLAHVDAAGVVPCPQAMPSRAAAG